MLFLLLIFTCNAFNTKCQKWKDDHAELVKLVRWCYDCLEKNTGMCIAPTGVHCNVYFSIGPAGPLFGCDMEE